MPLLLLLHWLIAEELHYPDVAQYWRFIFEIQARPYVLI